MTCICVCLPRDHRRSPWLQGRSPHRHPNDPATDPRATPSRFDPCRPARGEATTERSARTVYPECSDQGRACGTTHGRWPPDSDARGSDCLWAVNDHTGSLPTDHGNQKFQKLLCGLTSQRQLQPVAATRILPPRKSPVRDASMEVHSILSRPTGRKRDHGNRFGVVAANNH